MVYGWWNTQDLSEKMPWTCGYCGKDVAGTAGYRHEPDEESVKRIYICPHCENPTAFIQDDIHGFSQYPAAICGHEVPSLPQNVDVLYDEIRRCVQYKALTAAVLAMRKLIMHLAVENGANEGLKFVEYVEFLSNNNWTPPTAKTWVDTIRKKGNEANHQIVFPTEEEVQHMFAFIELLLRFMYEFPARLTEVKTK